MRKKGVDIMVNPLYTSAIYEEEQNELNDCISVISNISSFDKDTNVLLPIENNA